MLLTACRKEGAQGVSTEDPSSIKYVLGDNFNLSAVTTALQYGYLLDTLAKRGPYTFLAADNPAFLLANVQPTVALNGFYYFTPQRMHNILGYSILPGRLAFDSLPLGINQPLSTLIGGHVYISRWLANNDTVTTANGLRLKSLDNAASNGLIQILPQLLNPELYPTLSGYIHSDSTLTLFAAAVQRAGLDLSILSGKDPFTILAPSNAAFRNSASLGMGVDISSMSAILQADPAALSDFLKYHILSGRWFQGDLYRQAATDPSGITMQDGNKVTIGGDPNGYHAITFLGSGNNGIPAVIATPISTYNPSVVNSDIPCGNGVIHIINRVLIP